MRGTIRSTCRTILGHRRQSVAVWRMSAGRIRLVNRKRRPRDAQSEGGYPGLMHLYVELLSCVLYKLFVLLQRAIFRFLLEPQGAVGLSSSHKSKGFGFLKEWEKLWRERHDQSHICIDWASIYFKKVPKRHRFAFTWLQYRTWRNIVDSHNSSCDTPILVSGLNQKRS